MTVATEIRPETAFDQKEFRNALGTFPTGVAIITTKGLEGEPVGLTCNSFSSVSLEPPLVSWSLRKASKSLETFRHTPAFTINILAGDQNELSGRFASSKITDKFSGVDWRPGHGGAPVIANTLASFECSTFAVHDAGDHLIFIGQVQVFDHGRPEDPLVFYKGAYMMLTQSLRELVSSGPMQGVRLHEARRLIHGMMLRLACARASDEDLQAIARNLEEIERLAAPEDKDRRAQASLFHLIAKASHNEVLVAVSESLTTVLRHVVKASGSAVTFRPELVPLRKAVLERLRARDAAGAEREMNALLEQLSHVPGAGAQHEPGGGAS